MLSCNNGPVLVYYALQYHTTISASAEKDPKATVHNADSESVGHKLSQGQVVPSPLYQIHSCFLACVQHGFLPYIVPFSL
jgi:hypothetical protein